MKTQIADIVQEILHSNDLLMNLVIGEQHLECRKNKLVIEDFLQILLTNFCFIVIFYCFTSHEICF